MHLSKNTRVRLRKVGSPGKKFKIHYTRKDLEFSEDEIHKHENGWYIFKRDGFYLIVRSKYVMSDNIWQLF